MILSYKFLKFSHYSCFRGQGIQCWYFYRATLFELPRKSRSTSGSRVPRRYWWLYLMDFHNFFTIYVFEVKESIVDILTELRCLIDLENPSQLPVWEVLVILSYKFLKFSHYSCFWGQGIHCWYFYIATMFRWPRKSRKTSGPARTRGYWWLCLVDFWNFFTIYVFEVRESFDDIPTELPCLGDLKNSGHLPVQEVFELTQTFVPWHKSSKFISSRTKVAGRLDDQRFIVNCIVMSCIVKSCHVMPRHVTSCHVMPRHVTSCHVMSCHITSFHVMPRHVTSCYVMLRHATSCHIMSRHVTSCHVMSRHATSCHVMSRHVKSFHVMPRLATSYHVMSRHVMSRHVTSCHVISRHVMSCHVTSYHVMSRHVTSKVAGLSHDQRFFVNWLLPHAVNSS
jgi:hypothetical protein